MVCLDFAKAFDTVDHEVLIEEMGKAGIEYTALTWMSNWILGDMFQCRIGETLSEQKEITSGCKQGSCLGPLHSQKSGRLSCVERIVLTMGRHLNCFQILTCVHRFETSSLG